MRRIYLLLTALVASFAIATPAFANDISVDIDTYVTNHQGVVSTTINKTVMTCSLSFYDGQGGHLGTYSLGVCAISDGWLSDSVSLDANTWSSIADSVAVVEVSGFRYSTSWIVGTVSPDDELELEDVQATIAGTMTPPGGGGGWP